MDVHKKLSFNYSIIEQVKLLVVAIETTKQLLDNFAGLIQDFSLICSKNEREQSTKMNEFQHYYKKISDYIEHVHIEIPALMNVINESDTKLKNQIIEHQNKIKEHNDDILKFQMQIKESEQRYDKTINELEKQSTYSSAMGSTLAKMLWKTSKSESVIKTYIDTDTLNPFLNIVNNTIDGFQEAYHGDFPSTETFETNFLLSLFGIYTNIVAQEVGRNFVLEHEAGVSSINKILLYLKEMEIPTAQLLKRLILMFLYNLSITKQGAKLLANNEDGIDNILICLNENHTEEIQSISVSLIISLIKELDFEFRKKIKVKLSRVENFQNLMNSNDDCLSALCAQLIEKLDEKCISDD